MTDLEQLRAEHAAALEARADANKRWLDLIQSDRAIDQTKLEALENAEDEAAKLCRRLEAKIRALEAAQRAHDEANTRAEAKKAANRVSEANSAIGELIDGINEAESRLDDLIDKLNAQLSTRHTAAAEFHRLTAPQIEVPADADQIQAQTIRANAIRLQVPKLASYISPTLEATAHRCKTAFLTLSNQSQTLG